MNTDLPGISELLRWRLARAEEEAPPTPRASRLLAAARPWWETWPAQFQGFAERLTGVQATYGHAMAEPVVSRGGNPVPVMIVGVAEEIVGSASILYLDLRDDILRLRFCLVGEGADRTEPAFEVTFISPRTGIPLFEARALRTTNGEYRIEAEMPEPIAAEWGALKVTDLMPFRLLLRVAGGD
jgi:hypothetical protein